MAAVAAGATGTAVATRPTGGAAHPGRAGHADAACAADAAGSALTKQQPALAAGTSVAARPAGHARATGRARASRTTIAPVAEHARRPAVAAVLAGQPGTAVAAVAEQQAPIGSVLARTPVGAVADQDTSGQRLGARIEQGDRVLSALHRDHKTVELLGEVIQPSSQRQGPHELVMKRHRVGAQRLKLRTEFTEPRRYG